MASSDTPDATAHGLRLCLMNAPCLQRHDGGGIALERHDAALLAMLALDGPSPRARLAATLWPETTETQARTNLRQRLFRLRRLAGHELVRDRGQLELAAGLAVDLADMPARLAEDAQACRESLLGSDTYGDHDELEHWVRAARERWRVSLLEHLARLASQHETQGRIAAALPYAQRLLAEDPLQEHGHRRLIRLHYLRGDRAAALAAFERCRELLKRELGVAPGPETAELARLVESARPMPASEAAKPRPLATLRPPRLIGREAPWRQLQTALQQQRLIFLSGEAGIGKSRLLGDFATMQAGAALSGARPGDALLPYATLARLLRQLAAEHGAPASYWVCGELARIAPEFGAAAGGTLVALRLQQALAEALSAWCAAGLKLILLDDLQFADEASLELLPALVAATRGASLAWALACRSSETPAALSRWLIDLESGDLESGGLETVPLGPLDGPAVQALLESLALPGLDAAAWAGPLHRHTGGNPMFLLETLIALLDQNPQALGIAPQGLPSPGKVGQLIERRLGQLTPGALKLARVAAIAGQDFSVDLAAQVLGLHALDIADHWRELEAALVIRDNGFAHDLIFEATLRAVPAVIKRALHEQVAQALEPAAAPAARVARHWHLAGSRARAAAQYERAADDALASGRHDEELTMLDAAIGAYVQAENLEQAFRMRCRRVDALVVVGAITPAKTYADTLLGEALNDTQRLEAQLPRANAMLTNQDVDGGEAAAREAVELARRLGRRDSELIATLLLAAALSRGPEIGEALRLLEAMAPEVSPHLNWRVRLKFHDSFGYVLAHANRRHEAMQQWLNGIALAEQHHELADAVTLLSNLAGTTAQLGLTEMGLAHAERARVLRERMGDVEGITVAANDMVIGLLCVTLGRYAQALAALNDALARARAGGEPGSAWTRRLRRAPLHLVVGARAAHARAPGVDPAARKRTRRALRPSRHPGVPHRTGRWARRPCAPAPGAGAGGGWSGDD